MYLVDTSVWIDFFRNAKNPTQDLFTDILDRNLPFGISPIIYQEILQGAKSQKDFEQLEDYLGSQRFYNSLIPTKSACDAAAIYFKCRQKGVTVRSTIDCLIAQTAIEHNLVLLHNDRDFAFIAQIDQRLRLV